METNEQSTMNNQSGMELTTPSMNHLSETGKWTKFLSILGFVYLGLMLIMPIFMIMQVSRLGAGSQMPFGPAGGAFMIPMVFISFILIIILFFPIFYLYKFSSLTKKALNTKSGNELEQAFQNLKTHYRFVGILTIIGLAFYLIAFIFVVFGQMFMHRGLMNM